MFEMLALKAILEKKIQTHMILDNFEIIFKGIYELEGFLKA